MDWFEELTGFVERPETVRSKLFVEDGHLTSRVNGESYRIGRFELPSLAELRARLVAGGAGEGRLELSVVEGDVRRMHADASRHGALFQVASQFNMLEMVMPDVTPEAGVTGYQYDRTQGPACAIAAGAATIYRNYFVPVADGIGQTAGRQLDGLADLGSILSDALALPTASLWAMRNGYALCSREGLDAISGFLAKANADETDELRAAVRIGVHSDVEVRASPRSPSNIVSQAFCSALPVAYSDVAPEKWKRFALLILEAAYEATLCAAALNARRGASNVVLLTLLGGGAFGNDDEWIFSSIRRSLDLAREWPLDVRIVSRRRPSDALSRFVEDFRARR